jgi:hypothetical protein
MPPEVNPRMAFERLFGTEDLSLDPKTRARRMRYRKSILDMAREDTRQLVSTLGPNDKRKMDEYLTSVREIELRIEKAEKETKQVSPGIEKPAGIPVSFLEYSTLMFDLAVIAFQTDLTRINTIMLGREAATAFILRLASLIRIIHSRIIATILNGSRRSGRSTSFTRRCLRTTWAN